MSDNENPFGFKSPFFQDLYTIIACISICIITYFFIMLIYGFISNFYDWNKVIKKTKKEISVSSQNFIKSYDSAYSFCKQKVVDIKNLSKIEQNMAKKYSDALAKAQYVFTNSYISSKFSKKSTGSVIREFNCHIRGVWNTLEKSCDLDLKSPKVFNAELNQLLKQIDNDVNKSNQFWNLLTTSSYFESGEFIDPDYAYCAPASKSIPGPI